MVGRKMKYTFYYYLKKTEQDKMIEFDAFSDREAVLKLLDLTGICEFGCIREDGKSFSDNKFKLEKELILQGC